MQHQSSDSLNGMNPADLLRRGTEEDTIIDGNAFPLFSPPPPEKIAELLPQFEIIELIGAGGMGAVYKARQRKLDRIVALKILPWEISANPAFAEQFEREAKVLAKLNHPGIVAIYDFGQNHDLYYIVMEYVDGISLKQLMKKGSIHPQDVLPIISQICDALQFAHDHSIIHRDIKPENILLDKGGQIKIADFGLAKLIYLKKDFPVHSAQETILMKNNQVMGTPAYMAPEQFIQPSTIDNRTDIYSLGVVFYQMLTGELPGNKVLAPSQKAQIDESLDQVVLQALEKDPERRYSKAGDMKTRLEEVKEIQEQGRKQRRGRKRGREKGKIKAILLLILLIIGVLIITNLKTCQPSHTFDFPGQIPEGIILGDSYFVKREDLPGFEQKMNGKIDRIGNFMFTLGDSQFQINVICAPDEQNAEAILSVLRNKYGKKAPYSLRKNNLVFEYYDMGSKLDQETVINASKLLELIDLKIHPIHEELSPEETFVREWLSLADETPYDEELYNKDDPQFAMIDASISQEVWRTNMMSRQKHQGKALSRKLTNPRSLKTISDKKPGERLAFRFKTELEDEKSSLEIIGITKQPDGTWRVTDFLVLIYGIHDSPDTAVGIKVM